MKQQLDLGSVPTAILVVLAVVALAELTLDVVALVDLARRPRSAVAFGNKWIWVAIILLLNLVGAIVYLVLGRKQVLSAEKTLPAGDRDVSTESVADVLYGERGEQDAR